MLMAELLSEYFIALDIRLDIERRNIILSANISLLVFATLNVRLFSSAKYIKKSKIEESSFSESKNSLFAEINHQATTAPAPSDRYTRGFLTGRPRVFSLFMALTYAMTSPTWPL